MTSRDRDEVRLDCYAVDATGLQRLVAWNAHLRRGTLAPTIRLLVEARVSQINGCTFCLAMHTDEARHAAVPQTKLDTLAAWRDDESFTEQEAAAFELAEAMTRLADMSGVPDSVWSRARASFDDAELAALVQVVALINAFNRINVSTRRTAQDYQTYKQRQSGNGERQAAV
jgi:AhpD family alkylhydroperoxidase